MNGVARAIRDWAPILVPILALLAGGGWLQYLLNRRRAIRERFRTNLEDFLLPFDSILTTTEEIFKGLQSERELESLEHHPGRLQEYFGALPDDDPRKQWWRTLIHLVQQENGRAVDLVERFIGRIVLDEFRTACDEYLLHAKLWKSTWEALAGSGAIPAALNTSGALYARQFPSGLRSALEAEISEVRRQAGGTA